MVSLEMRDDGKKWRIERREKFISLLFCFMPVSSEKLISWDMSYVSKIIILTCWTFYCKY